MITVTTRRDKIQSVPASYDRQYSRHYGEAFLAGGRDPYDTTLALRKLNLAACSAEDVDAVMGNSSWTEMKRDHCEADVPALVNVSGPYESMSICSDCAREAAIAIETAKPTRRETGSARKGESAGPQDIAQ